MISNNSSAILFGRVITAMVTPFKDNGTVNILLAIQLAEHLATHGSDALIICGTTGESPTLSITEKQYLFKALHEEVGSEIKLLIGTGSNSTIKTVNETKTALELGADGALIVTPYYNKPMQDGIEAHFRTIAKSTPDLPLMLYNIPSRTGCNLAPETVGRLMDLSNIVSFKAASGSTEEVSQLRQMCGKKFNIYSGDDSLTLPMLAVGATGVVSVASHLVGFQMNAMINAFFSGDNTISLSLHEELLPLFKALFSSTNPIAIKAALGLSGWFVGNPRLPLLPASNDIVKLLSSTLDVCRPI